jgi:endonuclease IV
MNVLTDQFIQLNLPTCRLSSSGQLLNKQSNKTIHKYTDTAHLIDKGGQSRKRVQNINKLITNILNELKTTIHIKHQRLNYSVKSVW